MTTKIIDAVSKINSAVEALNTPELEEYYEALGGDGLIEALVADVLAAQTSVTMGSSASQEERDVAVGRLADDVKLLAARLRTQEENVPAPRLVKEIFAAIGNLGKTLRDYGFEEAEMIMEGRGGDERDGFEIG